MGSFRPQIAQAPVRIQPRRGSRGERLANVLTHGVGLVLSLVGSAVLMTASIRYGSVWHVVGAGAFSFGLILLYSASTLYHAFEASRLKHIFRSLDHSAIFVLIAGTYTPFTLVNLRGAWGWSLFGVIWGLALGGVILKIFLVGRFPALSTGLYVLMGWVAIIALKPLLAAVPRHGLLWLLAGGLFYTGGVLFYVAKKMPYSHAVWHLFVLGGSVCHYGAVWFYVLPRPPA
jgi:hemolysin III